MLSASSFIYLLNMAANIAPPMFCQTEYNTPGTVASARCGKWVFANPRSCHNCLLIVPSTPPIIR